MSVFSKAAARTAEKKSEKKVKKETVWSVGGSSPDHTDDEVVAESISALKELSAERKTIEAREKVYKEVCKKRALELFYRDYARTTVFPETPMKLQNPDGESVTLVVQERNQYPVKDSSLEDLVEILGEDAAQDMVYEETVFGFNREVLAKDGVMEVLGEHIEAAMEALVSQGVCSSDEAESLLDATEKRSYRPGVTKRLGMICGKDAVRMREVCDAMGSGCVQYIKS